MGKKNILIGILVILLALAGTVSAFKNGNLGYDCYRCHGTQWTSSNIAFYNQTHRYNDTLQNPPSCENCHAGAWSSSDRFNFSLRTGTPTYLNSTTCSKCHKAKYDNWTNTLHRVMLTEKSKAQAMNLPEPEVGWANISYVIVTKFQLAYINTTGYFLAQNDEYNTENMTWENSSHAGGAYGTCGRCHTTGWNTSGWSNITLNGILPGINGTFSEPGIACERCHQPAGNGHQVTVNYSGDQCRECHTGGNHGTGWENGEHAPPPFENGSCMFCHSSFDQYKNPNVTIANATGVSCGVCHNIHDMTDNKYAATFSEGIFNASTWSEVADSKLSFFNATASIAAGTDLFDDLSNRLLYPGTDTSRKDASYGTAPIDLTGRPVSEVLCSMCHYRHGLAHTAAVNLTHSRMNYPQNEWATCTDCHMAGTNATVGKDMMKMHANDPLTPNSCGGTTKCHTTSAQNLSASSHSVIPNINEWKASAHNDMEVGVNKNPNSSYYRNINGTTGIVTTASRMNSCDKCHSPFNWNPLTDFNSNGTQNTATVKLTPDNFKGIICAVCHNFHDMGDWLKKTNATFGESKAYAWYNKDAVVAATNATTGAITRYKANYTMMPNTIELCGNCHSNIRIGNEGPGWNGSGGNPTGVHGFPAKDIFVGSFKQSQMNFECIDCHMATMIKDSSGSVLPDSQKVKGHSFKVNATILMGTNCSNCHKTGNPFPYSDLSTTIEKIQAETHDKWNATNITVQSALAQVKAHSGEKNVSRDLIAKAYWNLRLVSSDESWGVHNPNKTNELLDNATALSNEALTKLGQGGRTITVSPSTATLAINGTQIFNATAMDQNGTPMSGIIIDWVSNNTSVGDVSPLTATTDVSGGATTTFTAGAAGIVMITANNGTITGSANVIVTTSISPPTLTTLTVSPPTAPLALNGTQVITATAKDQNNTAMAGINISWTVSNSTVGNVAPVDAVTNASGMVTTTFTAGAEGTAMVTATNNTVNGSANVIVTTSISPPTLTTIKVSPPTTSLAINGTQVITATAKDQNNAAMAGINIAWTVSNSTVGNVAPVNAVTNASGMATTTFTAAAEGTAMVIATNDSVTGSANVTVTKSTPLPITNPVVITIKVSPSDAGTVTITSPIGTTTTSISTQITMSSGSKVTFNVTPNDGYRFDRFVDEWNGHTFTTSLNPWTDTMFSNDVVTAVFVPTRNTVVNTIRVSPEGAGIATITSPIGTTTTSTSTQITIPSGSKVTFNVTPNDGYRFDRFVDEWNGHTFTTSLNPWTDTMFSNDVVTAIFVPTGNTVVNTIRVSPAGAGTVQAVSAVGTTTTPPTTTLIIPVNSKVEFKAIPNKGFKFDHWLDTWGISSSFQTKQNPWTDTMSSSDITTAVFVPIPKVIGNDDS